MILHKPIKAQNSLNTGIWTTPYNAVNSTIQPYITDTPSLDELEMRRRNDIKNKNAQYTTHSEEGNVNATNTWSTPYGAQQDNARQETVPVQNLQQLQNQWLDEMEQVQAENQGTVSEFKPTALQSAWETLGGDPLDIPRINTLLANYENTAGDFDEAMSWHPLYLMGKGAAGLLGGIEEAERQHRAGNSTGAYGTLAGSALAAAMSGVPIKGGRKAKNKVAKITESIINEKLAKIFPSVAAAKVPHSSSQVYRSLINAADDDVIRYRDDIISGFDEITGDPNKMMQMALLRKPDWSNPASVKKFENLVESAMEGNLNVTSLNDLYNTYGIPNNLRSNLNSLQSIGSDASAVLQAIKNINNKYAVQTGTPEGAQLVHQLGAFNTSKAGANVSGEGVLRNIDKILMNANSAGNPVYLSTYVKPYGAKSQAFRAGQYAPAQIIVNPRQAEDIGWAALQDAGSTKMTQVSQAFPKILGIGVPKGPNKGGIDMLTNDINNIIRSGNLGEVAVKAHPANIRVEMSNMPGIPSEIRGQYETLVEQANAKLDNLRKALGVEFNTFGNVPSKTGLIERPINKFSSVMERAPISQNDYRKLVKDEYNRLLKSKEYDQSAGAKSILNAILNQKVFH